MAQEEGTGGLHGAIWVFVPLAAVSCALTMPFLGARPDGDLVSRLERLARLHRGGALDDDEYEAAKRRVLDQERPPS